MYQQIENEDTDILSLLKLFRSGDKSLIATIKLDSVKGQVAFLRVFIKSIQSLQDACLEVLNAHKQEIKEVQQLMSDFGSKYNGYEIKFHPFSLTGKVVDGLENAKTHKKEVAAIKKRLSRNLIITKLAIEGFRAFRERVAVDDKDLEKLFAKETANMIITRILVLRFLEDNDFFGEKRYTCNGGVEAFQKMIEHFDMGYIKLIKEAYDKLSLTYGAIFEETELDWVFGSNDRGLSDAIEMVMFCLSSFDFSIKL